jgi:hypothetical protein
MALRTVTYIVNYSETPEVFQLYNTTPVNFPNPSSTPTNNVLVSFFHRTTSTTRTIIRV